MVGVGNVMTDKRVTVNSLREELVKFGNEVSAILLGEREERERSFLEKLDDWCDDQLMTWADHLDRHYGLWVVGIIVFLVLTLTIGLTVRLI